jgi:heterodisulfide reductase subunit B
MFTKETERELDVSARAVAEELPEDLGSDPDFEGFDFSCLVECALDRLTGAAAAEVTALSREHGHDAVKAAAMRAVPQYI